MDNFKKRFYLHVAHYFSFWAKIVLNLWKPEIILVTGSSGKTSLFYMLQAQLGDKAVYAEHANSAYGIPFHILGLERETYTTGEWIKLFLMAPFCLTRWRGRAGIYVVEADAERPGEAEFLQRLLQPRTVIITNIFQTHATYFDELVAAGQYPSVQDAVAAEFVKYLRAATKCSLINADNQVLYQTVENMDLPASVREKIVYLQAADYLREYKLNSDSTQFVINGQTFTFPYFLPREVALGIEATRQVCELFGVRMKRDFDNYQLAPGRSSILRGIRGTTLIDSTYNANLGSAIAMLDAYWQYPAAGPKWLVLGEFRELGQESQAQHLQLADYLTRYQDQYQMLVLISPEMQHWVYPVMRSRIGQFRLKSFTTAGEAYRWLWENLRGGETILLKGSQGRHLEGIVEGLLADPADSARLSCRNPIFRPAQEEILSYVNKQQEQGTP